MNNNHITNAEIKPKPIDNNNIRDSRIQMKLIDDDNIENVILKQKLINDNTMTSARLKLKELNRQHIVIFKGYCPSLSNSLRYRGFQLLSQEDEV